jgi:hypothetical protein
VTHGVEGNIVDNSEIMDAMQSYSSVVGVPDGVALNIGLVDSSDHVEMKGVTTQFKGLANIGELNVLNSSDC